MPGLFIVGTDTSVGKTRVASVIATTLFAAGKRVGVYKPVASGCVPDRCGVLQSDDAQELWHAAGRPATLAQVCPQRFLAPLAPDLAAREEGRTVDDALLIDELRPWCDGYDVTLIEGAGGLLSPLSESRTCLDLAAIVGWPLIVVVPNKLGAINQAAVTLVAARALAPNLPIAGVVLNHPTPRDERRDPSQATNRHEIERRCKTRVLSELAYRSAGFEEDVNWLELCRATGV
ncbi:MAG: dethiobiotin synthase [Pirellulales bacterium]